MPDCPKPIDVAIGKEVSPVGSQGNSFNIWVSNAGAPITFPAGGFTVTDNIPAGMTVTSVSAINWTCTPTTLVGPGVLTCTYNLAGSLATGADLPTSINVYYTTTGPGPFQNCATVAIGAVIGSDTNPKNDTACVTVTPKQVGSLIVTKTLTSLTPIPLPPGTLFPMTVTCGPPPLTASFSLTANGSYTVNNIPLGNTCTVTETLPALPPNLCPQGVTAVWDPPTYTPPNAVIGTTPVTIVVHNTVRCVDNPSGALIVKKEVINHSPIALPSITFPFTVTCGSSVQNFSLADGGSHTTNGIPLNTSCSVVEGTAPTPPNLCPPNLNPVWTTSYVPPSPVTVTGGLTTVTVKNTLDCTDKPAGNIDLAIAKSGGTTPVCQVGAYAFHITVTNGPNPWPGTGKIVVTDTVPLNMTFAPIVSPPWSCLPPGPYAAGTTFTCTYNGPAPTANQVLPPINISATATIGPPFPPYTNCASVAIPSSSGYVDTNPANNNACVTVAKPSSCSCPPPQVMNADGRCVCPPPMVTGATPNTCVCPQGTTLIDGKCVPVIICKPPLVLIPGVGCRCPDGGVLVDGKCVHKIVCDRPLVPNAAGTRCVCRDGLVLRDGKCVKVSKPKPRKTCKRGFVWDGDSCVKRKIERKQERSRERPGIRIPLPGVIPRGGRDAPSRGTR